MINAAKKLLPKPEKQTLLYGSEEVTYYTFTSSSLLPTLRHQIKDDTLLAAVFDKFRWLFYWFAFFPIMIFGGTFIVIFEKSLPVLFTILILLIAASYFIDKFM